MVHLHLRLDGDRLSEYQEGLVLPLTDNPRALVQRGCLVERECSISGSSAAHKVFYQQVAPQNESTKNALSHSTIHIPDCAG